MSLDNNNLETIIMTIISNAGTAKSLAIEAIRNIKDKNKDLAKENIEEARKLLNKAHNAQTQLLHSEAAGDGVDVSLLLVHAQDHLMTSITTVDIVSELIEIFD